MHTARITAKHDKMTTLLLYGRLLGIVWYVTTYYDLIKWQKVASFSEVIKSRLYAVLIKWKTGLDMNANSDTYSGYF